MNSPGNDLTYSSSPVKVDQTPFHLQNRELYTSTPISQFQCKVFTPIKNQQQTSTPLAKTLLPKFQLFSFYQTKRPLVGPNLRKKINAKLKQRTDRQASCHTQRGKLQSKTKKKGQVLVSNTTNNTAGTTLRGWPLQKLSPYFQGNLFVQGKSQPARRFNRIKSDVNKGRKKGLRG